jgi:metal-responsive CopG/Arc/MetJ family transcriptional regulator
MVLFTHQEERAMRATVTIDNKILDELLAESGQKNKASAVREAVALYLKQKKIERIKQKKGKVRFDKTADEIRHYER